MNTTALRPRKTANHPAPKTLTHASPCPECGDRGPHADNGEPVGSIHLTFLCNECGNQFDAVQN